MTLTEVTMYTKLIVKANYIFHITQTNCLSETNRPANYNPSIQRNSASFMVQDPAHLGNSTMSSN